MDLIEWMIGLYVGERAFRLVKIGPRTLNQLFQDTTGVDFPSYCNKRSYGVAFTTKKRLECDASGRVVSHSVIRRNLVSGPIWFRLCIQPAHLSDDNSFGI